MEATTSQTDPSKAPNGIENFWSLLKRGLNGTYVSVEPYRLFRYLDERLFAFNLRDKDDYGRFAAVLTCRRRSQAHLRRTDREGLGVVLALLV
jgi:hypothetical protein